MACQICLEDFEALQGEQGDGFRRVQKLCDDACSADICAKCLTQHIKTTIDACGTGMLPRVRCPICLRRINKTQWYPYVATNDKASFQVVYDFELRAQQALSLLTPCCHDPSYTHLVGCPYTYKKESMDKLKIPGLEDDDPFVVELNATMVAYNEFRVDKFRLLNLLPCDAKIGGIYGDEALQRVMVSFFDDERRATLQLASLYRDPIIETTCCGKSVCFNCKREHSDKETCDDDDGFDEDTCVVVCRECRVMLVKTDGCDSVYCPCGFEMYWSEELKWRRMHMKQLLPVDLFDMGLMETVRTKSEMLEASILDGYDSWRKKHVASLIKTNLSVLRRALAKWARRRALAPENTV